jgi:hypothetical protein
MIATPSKTGDLVEVRSLGEVLATLDANGCLDGMPFMPEMAQYCGKQFRVAASAHKSCDSTWFGLGRAMPNTVFLEELRCDGTGHSGCEADCLIFFKLAWLKPIAPTRDWNLPVVAPDASGRDLAWLRATVVKEGGGDATIYRCQATEHLAASTPYKSNAWSMFAADLRSRNATIGEIVRALLLLWVMRLRYLPFAWRVWNGSYEFLHRLFYGTRGPYIDGRIRSGQPTPDVRTDLKAGELVRVRLHDEVAATLNPAGRNRGLSFNMEMAPFCGEVHRVKRRVNRIVDEKTGRLITMKHPCIMLEGGVCKARYHPDTLLCRRKIPQYFREAWLERVPETADKR